ncbi:MAG: hypothetical protein KKD39_06805 [Candidatus Altiarchaeota archaeon]|nr:hypothetical protein [Candidatus Altiarchaeota archaeon]
MAPIIHYIEVSSFAKPGDAEKLKKIMADILPEAVEITETLHGPEAEGGVFKEELVEYTAKIGKPADMAVFHEKILSGLDDYDRAKIMEDIGSFVDDECNFYLRLSKNEAAQGCIVLESKDCIHLRYKLACYPAKRGNAVEAAEKIMSDGIR